MPGIPLKFYQELEFIFRYGKDVHFEDGMNNHFASRLLEWIDSFPDQAHMAVHQVIHDDDTSPVVSGEALRWIGRMDKSSEQHENWRLKIESCLKHDSHAVRDGAILALASMDDPKSIPALRSAMEQLHSEEREMFQQVVDQLRETLGWPPGYFEETAGSLADDPMEGKPPYDEQPPRKKKHDVESEGAGRARSGGGGGLFPQHIWRRCSRTPRKTSG